MDHVPVLLVEALDLLSPQKGETVIDVTLGLGGHALEFQKKIGRKGILIGVDADEKNLREAEAKGIKAIHANFRDLPSLDLPPCDVLFADLGLSSPHIDDPERGFSFRSDGPLDCRYDQSAGESAADLLMSESEEELAAIFRQYGELERSFPFARAICEKRKEKMIKSTHDLVHIAEEVYKWKAKKMLPQIFQALRIAVNDEMAALEVLLEHGPQLLKPDGRMGVISYHSLEDRMVKKRYKSLCTVPKNSVTGADLIPATFQLLTKKAIQPTMQEVEENPRARSAKFRVIQKI